MIKKNETHKRLTKKIKKGDKVIVLSGNDKGNVGTILRIMGDKAIVQGINIKTKHMKPTQQRGQGSIIKIERPIHISNLRVCTDENKPVKLKVVVNEQGSRSFYYKIDGQDVLYRTIKK
jgi:large subunit ribosomal protein L24